MQRVLLFLSETMHIHCHLHHEVFHLPTSARKEPQQQIILVLTIRNICNNVNSDSLSAVL